MRIHFFKWRFCSRSRRCCLSSLIFFLTFSTLALSTPICAGAVSDLLCKGLVLSPSLSALSLSGEWGWLGLCWYNKAFLALSKSGGLGSGSSHGGRRFSGTECEKWYSEVYIEMVFPWIITWLYVIFHSASFVCCWGAMPLNNVFLNELQLNKVSGSNLLAEFTTLEKQRELEQKYVPQLFLRMFEDVPVSYNWLLANLFYLSLVTVPKVFAKQKVSLAQFLSHFFSGSLRKQPSMLAPRRYGRFAGRDVYYSAIEIPFWWCKSKFK